MTDWWKGYPILLTPSRKKPKRGDVFAMKMPTKGYAFGLVVADGLSYGPVGRMLLVYYYDFANTIPEVDCTALTLEHLGGPPELTAAPAWTAGVFMTIGQCPTDRLELLPVHCFRRGNVAPDGSETYCDEFGDTLEEPYEPCGHWSVSTAASIWLRAALAVGERPPGP